MTSSLSQQNQTVTRKYPFLKNFPFPEFSIEIAEAPRASFIFEDEDDYASKLDPKLIKFVYSIENNNIAIVIYETELMWISEMAKSIQNLDKISKTLSKAIKSTDILAKRDAIDLAEAWCSQLEDNRTKLSYSTMSDILMSLIKNKQQLVSVVNKIAGLSLKKGLISMDRDEYQIILTYYHFQLIYTKLILGLVIASKISI